MFNRKLKFRNSVDAGRAGLNSSTEEKDEDVDLLVSFRHTVYRWLPTLVCVPIISPPKNGTTLTCSGLSVVARGPRVSRWKPNHRE